MYESSTDRRRADHKRVHRQRKVRDCICAADSYVLIDGHMIDLAVIGGQTLLRLGNLGFSSQA